MPALNCSVITKWICSGTSIYQRAKGLPKYVRYHKVSLYCMEFLFHIFNYYWGEEYGKNLCLRTWFLRTSLALNLKQVLIFYKQILYTWVNKISQKLGSYLVICLVTITAVVMVYRSYLYGVSWMPLNALSYNVLLLQKIRTDLRT